MMRDNFEKQLSDLNNLIIEMGGMIEKAITLAIEALKNQDVELAKQVIAFDDEVDSQEKKIESLCLRLLLQQSPVAKDLRQVSAALKMITDMERIGDQAADISQFAIYLANETYIKKLEHIPQMATATVKMVRDSLDAFVKNDLALARSVIKYDDVVDDLFDFVRDELITLIRADFNNGEQAVNFIMIAKYLERIGDHATNIAEWVEFSITGIHGKA